MPNTKTMLLKTATKLFVTKGYSAASVRQIASACNINISMISYYFKSKDGLYRAVLEQQIKEIETIIENASMPHSCSEKVEKYARGIIALFQKNQYFTRLISAEFSNPTPSGEEIIGQYLHKGFVFITQILEQGIKQQEFRENLPIKESAFLLAGILNFYLLSIKKFASATMKHISTTR